MNVNTETIINEDLAWAKIEKRKKIQRGIITLLFVLLSIAALHRLGVIQFPGEVERNGMGIVSKGSLPGISNEELLASLQGSADEDNMVIQLNGRPVFEDGESKGNLFLGNPEKNSFYKQVEITHVETGQLLYESEVIPPGYHIANDRLLKVLEQGNHPATANVIYYDGNEIVSQTSFNIEIVVKN